MTGVSSIEWAEFLNSIKDAKNEISSGETVWYRGHNNYRYYLLPSLLRYKNGIDKEFYLFKSFQKFGERIFEKHKSEWETLFDMQHYGVPTRLLDWSETFSIALFFAAFYNHSAHLENDAAIYLLNPQKLNKFSRINKIYSIPRDETEYSYTNIYWNKVPFAPSAPIAIEPNFINSRMLAQRGMFTVHDDSNEAIEERFPSAIRKIKLPKELIPAALEFLDLSNINEYTVYPDLGGIADFLRNSSGLER
jgi:hypothetical protein